MDTSKGSDGDTAGVCRRTASGFPRAAHGRTAARDRHVPPVGRLPAVRTGLRPSALGRYKIDRANDHPGDRAADDRGRADRPADGREPSPQGPHALQDAGRDRQPTRRGCRRARLAIHTARRSTPPHRKTRRHPSGEGRVPNFRPTATLLGSGPAGPPSLVPPRRLQGRSVPPSLWLGPVLPSCGRPAGGPSGAGAPALPRRGPAGHQRPAHDPEGPSCPDRHRHVPARFPCHQRSARSAAQVASCCRAPSARSSVAPCCAATTGGTPRATVVVTCGALLRRRPYRRSAERPANPRRSA